MKREGDLKIKEGDTISLKLGTSKYPKMVKLGAQCSNEEKEKFTELVREFQDVFLGSYEDLHDFHPTVIQHVIPIKKGIKPVRKK
jgi:hypothetical protein